MWNFFSELAKHYKDFGIIEFLIISFVCFLMYLVYRSVSDTSWKDDLNKLSLKSNETSESIDEIFDKLEEILLEINKVKAELESLSRITSESQHDSVVSNEKTHNKLNDTLHKIELFHNDLKTLIDLLKMFKRDGIL